MLQSAAATMDIESVGESVPFWKMSGSGNDFIVIDNRDERLPEAVKSGWAERVCRPHVALGADGVVLIEALPSEEQAIADVRWRYFNADGSEGEMCGNGAMCGARFAIEQGLAQNPCRLLTMSGVVRAEFDDEIIWLDLPDTGRIELGIELQNLPMPVTCHAVEVGVPHVVVVVDDADQWPETETFDEIGRAIRYHPRFPAGTNVNVISSRPDGAVRMRTWERGVEAETLACGTGAVASAVVATFLGLTNMSARVKTSGGRLLRVDGSVIDLTGTKLRLGGVASVVATGHLHPDAWRTSEAGSCTNE